MTSLDLKNKKKLNKIKFKLISSFRSNNIFIRIFIHISKKQSIPLANFAKKETISRHKQKLENLFLKLVIFFQP